MHFEDAKLFQLRVLHPRLLQEGNVCIGVFPAFKKVLVCSFRYSSIPCREVNPSQFHKRCWFDWIIREVVTLVEKALQFCSRFARFPLRECLVKPSVPDRVDVQIRTRRIGLAVTADRVMLN